jgi:hypothetical protein
LTVDADDRGRFTVPEFPAGGLGVYGQPTAGSPWFLRSPPDLKVEPGRTTRVEARPVKGVRLEGVVRERATGRPVAGIEVGLHGSPGAMVRTDAGGRFELLSRPGLWGIAVGPAPEGLAAPPFRGSTTKVPEGVAELELPPILMERAEAVRGVVVDERGEPVPGASVLAYCQVGAGPLAIGRQERRAIASGRGEFRIDQVVAGAAVELSASATDGRRTARPVEARAGVEPARLVLASGRSTSLAGRVVDTAGRRVDGARVHIRTEWHDASGQVIGDTLVEIRGAYVIKTNGTGWYRTPPILDPKLKYVALAAADGLDPARTGWTAGTARTFPELVLRPSSLPVSKGK